MKIAIVGATGLVGSVMLKVLEERKFPMDELLLVASERSVGKEILFKKLLILIYIVYFLIIRFLYIIAPPSKNNNIGNNHNI